MVDLAPSINAKQWYAKHITQRFKVEECTWNYCEAGHGKGAPDGVGGCLKRTADRFFARGTDIPNFEKLVSLLQDATRIAISTVTEEDIKNIELLLPKAEEYHENPPDHLVQKVMFNTTSWTPHCIDCQPEADCKHFGIGSINISTVKGIQMKSSRLQYNEVYSDKSSD